MSIFVIDILILIIFLFFGIGGYHKGLIKQTSTILGIAFALAISINYYNSFLPVIENYIDVSIEMMQFISFSTLFILINLFVHILGIICKRILDLLFLKTVDHAAGAVLGLVKGFLIAYFFVLILSHIPYMTLTEQITNSFLAVKILDMTPFLQNTLQNIFSP